MCFLCFVHMQRVHVNSTHSFINEAPGMGKFVYCTLKPRLIFIEPFSGVPGFSQILLLGSSTKEKVHCILENNNKIVFLLK